MVTWAFMYCSIAELLQNVAALKDQAHAPRRPLAQILNLLRHRTGTAGARLLSVARAPEFREQLVVNAAEAAVAHDQHMVAGFCSGGNRRDELQDIAMDFGLGAERRERGGRVPPQ